MHTLLAHCAGAVHSTQAPAPLQRVPPFWLQFVLIPTGGFVGLPVVHTSFNDAEREVENHYGHPIVRRAREGVEPTVEAIYAYGDNPRVYYIEATRQYRRLGQSSDECSAIGSGTGWFVRDAAGVRALTMVVDLLNCRREAGSYMLPLGVLKLNDRVYWLAQFAGWGHERYVVLEVKKKSVEVVINKWGGAC